MSSARMKVFFRKAKKTVEAKITPEKIKEAQALVDEWLAQHKMTHSMMKH